MILAGTSEKGCCGVCAAPYERITEKVKLKRDRPNSFVKRTGEDGTGNVCDNTVAGVKVQTVGWEPTCGCGADVVPCVVLDTFLGTGTTVAVAVKNHRRGIGIELNPEYAVMAMEKIEQDRAKQGLF